MGDVIGDISTHAGRVDGTEDVNGTKMIKGFVPLAEMFGYSTTLRSRHRDVELTLCSSMTMRRFQNVQDKVMLSAKAAAAK